MCPYNFTDRFHGEDEVSRPAKIFTPSVCNRFLWETNFIPDAKEVRVRDDLYVKGTEVGMVQLRCSRTD